MFEEFWHGWRRSRPAWGGGWNWGRVPSGGIYYSPGVPVYNTYALGVDTPNDPYYTMNGSPSVRGQVHSSESHSSNSNISVGLIIGIIIVVLLLIMLLRK